MGREVGRQRGTELGSYLIRRVWERRGRIIGEAFSVYSV